MKQFNLEEYLKNPSRKVVTRDGRGNSVTIRTEFYVHTLQHALRVVGLSEIADNFKV